MEVTSTGGWRFVPPRVRQKSSAGSGDAFTAAMLVERERGGDWPRAIRWACAAGTVKARESRTDHPLDPARVRAMAGRVKVTSL